MVPCSEHDNANSLFDLGNPQHSMLIALLNVG
jgi:hypothetical protein